ncbi:MAG TPA: thioredoxin domain-containing protein [Pyrinomonadaceae bacterium]|nr:thioredoxin domain-containing protein [Pyrinomonadaceae bacterium]
MSRNPKNAPAKSKSALPFVIIGAVLVAVTAAVVLMSRPSTSNSSTPAQGTSATPTQRMPAQPGAPNPYSRGSDTARITLEEFSDFQCPACGGIEPALRRVMQDYESRGVRLIFRNYPLQMHKYAFIASRAAEAAGLQGKFWEMHDLIYDNQKEWSDSMEPRVQFDSYATRLGLDVKRFKADMERQDLAERIKADMMRGTSLGVRGTPTIFLNGRELVPGQLVTEDILRREIEAALAQGK